MRIVIITILLLKNWEIKFRPDLNPIARECQKAGDGWLQTGILKVKQQD
jgi:hypothetical protein